MDLQYRMQFVVNYKKLSNKNLLILITFTLISIFLIGAYFFISQKMLTGYVVKKRVVSIVSITTIIWNLLLCVVILKVSRSIGIQSKISFLRKKIIKSFTLVTIIPTLIISILSGAIMFYGTNTWFHDKVSTAIAESVNVANAYLDEHKDNIRTDILFLANDIDRQFYLFSGNRELLYDYINLQKNIRSLSEIVIFQYGKVVSSTDLATDLDWSKIPQQAIKDAETGNIAVINTGSSDSVKSIIKLQNFLDGYVLASRYVDTKILNYIERASGASTEYGMLMANLLKFQYQLILVYTTLTILMVMFTTYYGINFASSLTNPITSLVDLAQKVQDGNLKVRSGVEEVNDEIGILAVTLDQMINKIEKQRYELVMANDLLADKIRFNEKILEGVTAGVIAIGNDHKIKLINHKAQEIFEVSELDCLNKTIKYLSTDFENIIKKSDEEMQDIHSIQHEVIINKSTKILSSNLILDNSKDSEIKYIITFDDITKLMSAQRAAAWSDVARRIAHEMKNPLTPIMLCAERIRKKLQKSDFNDIESVEKYINTIISNVENINSMVNEFVDFARLPSPVFTQNSIIKILSNIKNTFDEYSQNITINISGSFDPVINCDEKQIHRAILNIVKNSIESVLTTENKEPNIHINIKNDEKFMYLEIIDNGPGFADDIIQKLSEPYFTTKQGGTGLGLAIVKKIIEDHLGYIKFSNYNHDSRFGAIVLIAISRNLSIG